MATYQEVAASEAVALALIQGKFRALTPAIRPLLVELEQRRGASEYDQLLVDSQNIYTDVRLQLLSPIVASHLTLQLAETADMVAFVRKFGTRGGGGLRGPRA